MTKPGDEPAPGTDPTGEPATSQPFPLDGEGEARAAAHFALQRTALLRSVTHDLRTPLAAIRAIVTDLHAGVAYDDSTRVSLLQTVCDEVDRMDRLIGNLLSMSRIEAGVLAPQHQAIDVDELICHRLAVLAPLLRDFTILFDIEHDIPCADGDYGQIEEVLTNLLANAARHAPPGSTIDVRALRAPVVAGVGEGFVVIEVVDRGPGIDREQRDRLFQPFQRGAGSRSTGLGLAICHAIVQAHGGTIRILDTPGGGATVRFTVPVRRSTDRAYADRAGSVRLRSAAGESAGPPR